MRGSAAHSVLHAEVHHAAHEQAIQMEVGKVGGSDQDREHMHGGLQFRIGHQRQIDQALDRARPRGCARPSRIRPGPAPRSGVPGRSMPNRRRHVSALSTACASSDFTTMQLDLQVVDGRLVDFRRRRAATAPQSVARPCRSYRSETRTPRVRATGRTSTRTGCSSPFRPTAPCRPQDIRSADA